MSSQIEGTQSSLADFLLLESQEPPGKFRRTQSWLGGTRPGNARFVPPPPEEVLPCLGALEKYLRDDPEPTPVLIKAALTHVQPETIHPFLDSNGRIGRLLITLVLMAARAMKEPLLFLSLSFKQAGKGRSGPREPLGATGRQRKIRGAQSLAPARFGWLAEGDSGRPRETPGDQWVSRMWMRMWMGNRDTIARSNDQERRVFSAAAEVGGRLGCRGARRYGMRPSAVVVSFASSRP